MRATSPRRLMKFLVGASLTFLAMSLIAPASAKAGCDHPSDRPSIGLESTRPEGSTPTTGQAPRPKPCSGPSCSNKSAPSPTSTSSPQPPPRAELWGLLVETLDVASPPSAPRAPEDDLGRPIGLAQPVFHPPC